MVFSSIFFLFRFLPVFLILYFAVPKEYRNLVVLIGSLFFYAYGEPLYIILMILSIAVNFSIARKIYSNRRYAARYSRSRDNACKWWLVLAMLYNFGMLFVFKYLNFFLSIINGIAGSEVVPSVELALPLGISFYTFQMASFVADVYKDKYKIGRSILPFATYVCMFPQLIAGPIVNYNEVKEELKHREVKFSQIEWGVTVFIVGFVYKVLLANKIASLWTEVDKIGVYGINAATAWLASWGYSMQIFFDFFGYSLMAIGLGHIMGFKFPINFDDPYTAKSATEFWRRWHITLGRWFREYVYIPLGGNREGMAKMVFNTFVVWALTGLWHGANWNFIIWGLMYFVLLMIEKFFLLKYLEKYSILGHLYMMIIIPVGWTVFNITDLKTLGLYLLRMIGVRFAEDIGNGMGKFTELFGTYWWLLLICAVCCTPYPMRIVKRYHNTVWVKLVLLLLFWYGVYQLAMGANNPFLYFRF